MRSVLVSSRTNGSKLAVARLGLDFMLEKRDLLRRIEAALRARLLGEDGGESYRCLELKMAGKSAAGLQHAVHHPS